MTDFIAHTPPDILAQNFGVPAEAFSKTPLRDLYGAGTVQIADSSNFHVSKPSPRHS